MPADALPPDRTRVGAAALFAGFMRVGISGFGGVLPFARRILVDERHWLSENEFTEVLSLAQFLPGPNIINVTIIVGRRFRGVLGAVAASLGLMLLPMVIVLVLAAVYERFAQIDAVGRAVHAVSEAAAGLVLAMGFRMTLPLRHATWQIGIAALAFVAIALARLPLLWVIAVLAPLSIAMAWRARR